MINRPAVRMICYTDARGNPGVFSVGGGDVSEIRETEECAEYCAIPSRNFAGQRRARSGRDPALGAALSKAQQESEER